MSEYGQNNEIIKKIFFTAIITTFMGQVYINPFGSSFRVSMAIVALTLLLLEFDDIPILRTSTVTAVFVFCFRAFGDYIGTNEPYYILISRHLPSAFFYVIIGLLFSYLKIRDLRNNSVKLIIFLGLSDMMANIIEVFIREEFLATSFIAIFSLFFFTFFIISFITFLLFSFILFFIVLFLFYSFFHLSEDFIFLSALILSVVFFLFIPIRYI